MTEKPDDEIEIEGVEPATTDVVVEATTEAPAVEKSVAAEVSPSEGIEELKRSLAAEKMAREAAEARARNAELSKRSATADLEASQRQQVQTALEFVTKEAAGLKVELRDALAAGDFDKAADITEAMQNIAAQRLNLENGIRAMDAQAKKPAAPEPGADPVEDLASRLTPRSAAWVRAHPEYARNPRLYQKMVGAHNVVVSDDIAADTPEYFARVEALLGLTKPVAVVEQSALSEAAEPVRTRTAPAAAPVTRSGTANGVRPGVGRLSPEEREAAAMSNMTELEWKRTQIALKADGKIN